MSWFSSLAPAAGALVGGLLAAPTGGMSIPIGAAIGGMAGMGVSSAVDSNCLPDRKRKDGMFGVMKLRVVSLFKMAHNEKALAK